MLRTITVKANFTDEEEAFWVDQCQHANSLINCAIYETKQKYFSWLKEQENAFTTYWRGDDLRQGWKIYKSTTTYPELDKILKDNPHYKGMAAQAAQQTLKTVAESITSYNGLVSRYYQGGGERPSLPRYRKKGGLAAVTFPSQLLRYIEGYIVPPISRETKPKLITDVKLFLPEFIDSNWVKEVTIRPNFGELWIDWVIDDGRLAIEINPDLDYRHAWSFDHGGNNWLTGVSTLGESFIIDGRKLRSMNQGYSRLVAKYKQDRPNFYWDSNLDRIQLKRNNQMRDAINKATRFIVSRCLNDGIGNIIIGWNKGQKDGINLGKRNNQNFVVIPTGRLIKRLEQLCPEYGIKLTITEESYTSKASFLDDDFLPTFGEKPKGWESSGDRIERGLFKTKKGFVVNADCNGAANIMKKVATQLGLVLVKVSRGTLTVPHRYDLFNDLKKTFRTKLRSVASAHAATSV